MILNCAGFYCTLELNKESVSDWLGGWDCRKKKEWWRIDLHILGGYGNCEINNVLRYYRRSVAHV